MRTEGGFDSLTDLEEALQVSQRPSPRRRRIQTDQEHEGGDEDGRYGVPAEDRLKLHARKPPMTPFSEMCQAHLERQKE